MWCIVHVGHINKPQRRLSLGLRLSVPGILFMSIAASTVKCHLLVNGQTLKATVVYMCTWMFTAGVCGRWWHIGPSQYRRRPDVISVQSVAVVCVHMNVYSWFVWTLVAHWAQSISSPTWCRISTIPIHRVLCRQTLPSACASISLSVLSSLPTFIPSTKSRYCQQITPAFTWQHLHCGDCLEAKGEYYQNCFMMCCVRQLCDTMCEQFLSRHVYLVYIFRFLCL